MWSSGIKGLSALFQWINKLWPSREWKAGRMEAQAEQMKEAADAEERMDKARGDTGGIDGTIDSLRKGKF